jgi:hypothetical protein
MILKNLQIRDPLFMKLRAQQRTRIRPDGAVGIKNAIAEEEFPAVVEFFALAEIVELRCEDGFDVFGVNGDDGFDARGSDLRGQPEEKVRGGTRKV